MAPYVALCCKQNCRSVNNIQEKSSTVPAVSQYNSRVVIIPFSHHDNWWMNWSWICSAALNNEFQHCLIFFRTRSESSFANNQWITQHWRWVCWALRWMAVKLGFYCSTEVGFSMKPASSQRPWWSMASGGNPPFLARENVVKSHFQLRISSLQHLLMNSGVRLQVFLVPDTHKHMAAQPQHFLEW